MALDPRERLYMDVQAGATIKAQWLRHGWLLHTLPTYLAHSKAQTKRHAPVGERRRMS